MANTRRCDPLDPLIRDVIPDPSWPAGSLGFCSVDPLEFMACRLRPGEALAPRPPRVVRAQRSEDEVYRLAIKFVLDGFGSYGGEGGYVNNPKDPGGATCRGVTQKVYDAYRKKRRDPVRSVKEIADTEVQDIYRHEYWIPGHCKDLPDKLAVAHMDTMVNGGAMVVLNRALGFTDRHPFGSDTIVAISKFQDIAPLVESYLKFRDKRFDALVANNKTLHVFLKGWHSRVAALRQYIATL